MHTHTHTHILSLSLSLTHSWLLYGKVNFEENCLEFYAKLCQYLRRYIHHKTINDVGLQKNNRRMTVTAKRVSLVLYFKEEV
jgi:hypothetical protein